ncbi:uncharacterized protein LOC117100724 [Anneissia japonica]|uniref:uncharacterized protein LOC117100724 n=1 Tax=Anneissia japonica TaxID=1529436 RepID=UPI0014257651|nr:uncharacterized protein LOC117100724 [Anneissia japonica]
MVFEKPKYPGSLGERPPVKKRKSTAYEKRERNRVIQEIMANTLDESVEKENKDPVPQSLNKMEMETQTIEMHCYCCVHHQLKKQTKSSGFQWNGSKMIDNGMQILTNVAEAQTQTTESALRSEVDVTDISIDDDGDEEFDEDDKINDPDYIPEEDSDTEDELDEFDTGE